MQPNEKQPEIETTQWSGQPEPPGWSKREPPKSFLTDPSTIGAIAGSIFGATLGTIAGGATLPGLLGGGALGGGIGNEIRRWRENHPAKHETKEDE